MNKATRKILMTLTLALVPVSALAQTDTTTPSTTTPGTTDTTTPSTTTPGTTDTTGAATTGTTDTTATPVTTNNDGFNYGWLGLLGLLGLGGLAKRQPPVVHVDPRDTVNRP